MNLPEKPISFSELDLMRRLKAYADGNATWHADERRLGLHEQRACNELHSNLTSFVEKCLHPLLDRVTAREMQGFTMHDRGHGMKVAHLMWHILEPKRRESLTPGEIALLVASAHLHDLGMGLSESERKARLSPSSSLWETVEPDSDYLKALHQLTDFAKSNDVNHATAQEALYQVQQAQEALLCLDSRERHACKERYLEILGALAEFHRSDPENIINPASALSFDGDSFREKLIDICISHNEEAHVLTDPDATNCDQERFPARYPIGCCIADTRLVAAALRLADILDFDRERTPPVLFHYLLPRSADPRENVSVREWSKHLAISSWEIESERIVFRGRSPSAFVHHVIVEFCRTIEEEIKCVKSVYGDFGWPFQLKPHVAPEIEATGYRYIPYRFSLDEQRIYSLLMGEGIYPNKLDALRELIQNAVDACKLRDALITSHDPTVIPSKYRRIMIRYDEPTNDQGSAILSVIDTGIGMDRYIIENYFLKVGRSFYKSKEFLRTRTLLRQRGSDFVPVSEFGIGMMSVFMLGDRIEVETAPWEPRGQDGQRRLLSIDGIGRLIEVKEAQNVGASRFYGTRVSVHLKSRAKPAPTWDKIQQYVRRVCTNLDFPLILEHKTSTGAETFELEPQGLHVSVAPHLSHSAITIPVDDSDAGIRGEIVIYRAPESREAEAALASQVPVISSDQSEREYDSVLI